MYLITYVIVTYIVKHLFFLKCKTCLNVCFQLQDPTETAAAVEGDNFELAYRSATSQPAVGSFVEELGQERESLAFIAGYVAASCQHICRPFTRATNPRGTPDQCAIQLDPGSEPRRSGGAIGALDVGGRGLQ